MRILIAICKEVAIHLFGALIGIQSLDGVTSVVILIIKNRNVDLKTKKTCKKSKKKRDLLLKLERGREVMMINKKKIHRRDKRIDILFINTKLQEKYRLSKSMFQNSIAVMH
jgi:hypothetical protein